MHFAPLLALVLVPLAGWAQPPTSADPQLTALLQEVLERNPDLARDRSLVQAERERVPQAGALPDPSLSLGIQNDGFKRLQVGRMDTSFYQVMVTQPLPWPGKRGLRTEVARLGSEAAQATLDRTRLTLEADVRRGWLALLLARGQLRLLQDQALLLQEAEGTARARYEVGQGSQADLLRAQLERTRLEPARLNLLSQERASLAVLNRLRAQPGDTPLETRTPLEQVPEPPAIDLAQALKEAADRSPELRAARLGASQAERALALANLERRPDFGVSAGLMPRAPLDPMWTAGVSITLPIWGRQSRAVAEQEQRRRASGSALQSLGDLLAQRVRERAAQLEAALGILRLYRGGLLVQSEAAFRATLAQFEVGRAPFLSVLEALNGWVADRSGLLQAQAGAQAIQIAQAVFALDAAPAPGGAALGSRAMGAQGASAPTPGAAQAGPAGGEGEAPSMKTM